MRSGLESPTEDPRKPEIFISIRSKVMRQMLTVFDRVFVNFTLRTMFSTPAPAFDAKLHSASNDEF